MAKLPKQYRNQPELVQAVIEARRIQMTTNDDQAAITWLTEHYPTMSTASATRAIEHLTFQYVAMYPDGHPRIEELNAELRERTRRSKIRQGMRLQVVERDGNQCRHCSKPVTGHNSVLDPKDPEKGHNVENLHLLCNRCHLLKEDMSWGQFQLEWKTRFGDRYTKRVVDALFGTRDPQLDEVRLHHQGEADRCNRCGWIIIGDYGLNDAGECAHCVVGAPRRPEFQFPPDERYTRL